MASRFLDHLSKDEMHIKEKVGKGNSYINNHLYEIFTFRGHYFLNFYLILIIKTTSNQKPTNMINPTPKIF